MPNVWLPSVNWSWCWSCLTYTGPAEWLAALMTDCRIVDALLRCSCPTAHRVVIKVVTDSRAASLLPVNVEMTIVVCLPHTKECLWAVSNVLGGSEASRNFLIHYGSSGTSFSVFIDFPRH